MSFTSGEAATIQFFGELCCCNGNLPKGKAGVRRGINTHWGHIQAWLALKNICIIYVSSNIYLYKIEPSGKMWVTWHFPQSDVYSKKIYWEKKKQWFCRLLEWKDSWDFNIWALNHAPLALIFCNQTSPLFLRDLPISLTIPSVSSTPTGSLNERGWGGNVFIWLPYILQLL